MKKTKHDASKTKISSESTGFENIGKFYKAIRKIQQKHDDIKSLDVSIYMLLAEYSFGYMNNIQYELSISIAKIMTELNTKTNKAVIKSLKKLQDYNLIKRVKWQDIGPKQSYKYMIIMPQGYNISHKQHCNTGSEQYKIEDYKLNKNIISKIDMMNSIEEVQTMINIQKRSARKFTTIEEKNIIAYFNKEKPYEEVLKDLI